MDSLRINLLKDYFLINGLPSYKIDFKFSYFNNEKKFGLLRKENSIEFLSKLIEKYEPMTRITLTSKTPKRKDRLDKFGKMTNNELKELKNELEKKLLNYTIDFLPGGP